MNKRNQNSKKYNTEIINALAERFGITADYIRKCLRNVRVGILPDKIKAEYAAGVKALNETIEEVKNK